MIQERRKQGTEMWISKKRLEGIEKKIADLEGEQLSIRNYVKEAIKSDEDLIEIVKNLRAELSSSKSLTQMLQRRRR